LLGAKFAIDQERESHPIARAFRAFMAARSRFAEDELGAAIENGITQYVLLSAGLDTFGYRNQNPDLRVFEVDFPATQQWKRTLLTHAKIAVPHNLTFVAVDFVHQALPDALIQAAFNMQIPAFFSWLGVVPYLSLEAFRSTVQTIARWPRPSAPSHLISLFHRSYSVRAREQHSRCLLRAWRRPESHSNYSSSRKNLRANSRMPASRTSKWLAHTI
jgi:methyltransferase (TIGR00027 family)